MDGIYDIDSVDFSLKTMCAVKVAHQVLVAYGIRLKYQTVEKIAVRRVRQLELPCELRELVENFISSMMMEVTTWYRMYGWHRNPILTLLGTVDWSKSANAILLNETCKMTRFVVACDLCFEERIYELFSELTVKGRNSMDTTYGKTSSFCHFWMRVCSGSFGRVTLDRHLPQEANNEGFKLAWEDRNDFAIRYFINKASLEVISRCISDPSFIVPTSLGNMSPATFCLLVSKLSMADQQVSLPNHANYLLHMLLNWPYQSFFVEAAKSLTGHLTLRCYWQIVDRVFKKIVSNARNFNYRKLFTALWLAGSCHRNGLTPLHYVETIIFNVLVFKDEQLINFVLAETCAELKDALLMEPYESEICTRLFCKKEYRLLELFIGSCGMHRSDALLEFKKKFSRYVYECCSTRDFHRYQKLEMQWFPKIMSTIIDEE